MAKNSNPPRPGGPPRPAGPAGPKAPARPRPKTGGRSWSPPAAVTPATPKVEEPIITPAAPPKQDELAMVPLSGQSDGTYDDGRRSGSPTEFFAIPHANRAKASGPAGYAPAAPAPAPAAHPAHLGGPVPVGPVPVAGIQGPVAVGPGGPNAAGPYGMVDPNLDDGRTQSYRVFGVVIALVLMVCFALLVTVGLVVVAVMNQTPPEEPVVVQNIPAPVVPREVVDSGGPAAELPKPKPRPARPKPRPSSGPKPAPKPKPEEAANGGGPAGQAGTVRISIPAGVYVSTFEVSCPSSQGFRQRASFTNGTAVISNVPAAECTGRFKGGGVTSKVTIRGGSANLKCTSVNPSTLVCR